MEAAVRGPDDLPPTLRPRVGSIGQAVPSPLLGPDDPPPFRVVNPEGTARILFTSDHASCSVPRSLGKLGLRDRDLRRHIGWDPGAADLTLRLSELFNAPAVLSGYSRLVIDCNRTPGTEDSILRSSDGTRVPGNCALSEEDAGRREFELFHPYHDAIRSMLARLRKESGSGPAYIAMHTFTPNLDGFDRPWHVGVLWDRDTPLAEPLIAALRRVPGLVVGDNQPYSGTDQFDYSRVEHASRVGLPYVLLEVRSDLLPNASSVAYYSSVIGRALESALAALGGRWRTD